MSARLRATVMTNGALFAVIQFAFFFLVQSEVSAAVVTYFAVTAAWLVGLIAGLWVASNRLLRLAPYVTLAALYTLWVIVRTFTFSLAIVPALAFFVALAGAYAGIFFQQMATSSTSVRLVLFDENNGFIIGIPFAVAGFALFGFLFLAIAPPLMVFALEILRRARPTAL